MTLLEVQPDLFSMAWFAQAIVLFAALLGGVKWFHRQAKKEIAAEVIGEVKRYVDLRFKQQFEENGGHSTGDQLAQLMKDLREVKAALKSKGTEDDR